jgi:hypothetical protein
MASPQTPSASPARVGLSEPELLRCRPEFLELKGVASGAAEPFEERVRNLDVSRFFPFLFSEVQVAAFAEQDDALLCDSWVPAGGPRRTHHSRQ